MIVDLVLSGGVVIDGTGAPGRRADVGISTESGTIAAIGRFDTGPDATIIDATGLTVAPGFIDIHSHSDYTLLIDPRAMSAIAQGVTLEVIGNCGFGCAPIADPRLAANAIYGFDNSIPLTWQNIGGYLEKLEAARPAIHDAGTDHRRPQILCRRLQHEILVGGTPAEQRPGVRLSRFSERLRM